MDDIYKKYPTPRTDAELALGFQGRDGEVGAEFARQLERELALAQAVIAWANNSLFGSHGFFLSTRGGLPDEHHLDMAIEDLKTYGKQQWRRAEEAETKINDLHKTTDL